MNLIENVIMELEKLKQDYVEPRKLEWDYSVIGANIMIDKAIEIIKKNLEGQENTFQHIAESKKKNIEVATDCDSINAQMGLKLPVGGNV